MTLQEAGVDSSLLSGISPSSLLPGTGLSVCMLLDALLDLVISKSNLNFGNEAENVYGCTQFSCENLVEEEEEIEEKELADCEYVELPVEETCLHRDDANENSAVLPMIICQIAPADWREECQRVSQFLKRNNVDSNYYSLTPTDWRLRTKAIMSDIATIQHSSPLVLQGTREMLYSLTANLNAINDLENYSISSSPTFGNLFKSLCKKVEISSGYISVIKSSLERLSIILNEVSLELELSMERVRQQRDLISDKSPLVSIKEAIHKLRSEIKVMEVKIKYLSRRFYVPDDHTRNIIVCSSPLEESI